MNKKSAVVFYSYTGNIRKIANWIGEVLNIDVIELKPEGEYPSDLNALLPIAKHEIDNRTGREYMPVDFNRENYDQIFLCTPNWGNTMAPPLLSFLRNEKLENKILIPVITHQGTGKGRFVRDIKKEVKHCTLLPAFVDYDKRTSKDDIAKWVKGL